MRSGQYIFGGFSHAAQPADDPTRFGTHQRHHNQTCATLPENQQSCPPSSVASSQQNLAWYRTCPPGAPATEAGSKEQLNNNGRSKFARPRGGAAFSTHLPHSHAPQPHLPPPTTPTNSTPCPCKSTHHPAFPPTHSVDTTDPRQPHSGATDLPTSVPCILPFILHTKMLTCPPTHPPTRPRAHPLAHPCAHPSAHPPHAPDLPNHLSIVSPTSRLRELSKGRGAGAKGRLSEGRCGRCATIGRNGSPTSRWQEGPQGAARRKNNYRSTAKRDMPNLYKPKDSQPKTNNRAPQTLAPTTKQGGFTATY